MGASKSLQGQITRMGLVLSAAAILQEEGPDKVTYRKVASRTGVAPSTVSYYFSSPDDLLYEAAVHNRQVWMDAALEAVDRSRRLTPEECREQIVDLLVAACLPDDDASPWLLYTQLISSHENEALTNAYRKGRHILDPSISAILKHANMAVSPQLIVAVVDGAAVSAISEKLSARETATALLQEALAPYR